MEELTHFLNEWRNETPTIPAYTSGSTGKPKRIELLKSDMITSAMATNTFFGITSHATLGLPLSLNYIAGKMMVVRAEIAGCRLLILPVSNSINITENIDLLSVVPSQLDSLLDHKESLTRVKKILVGGAPISTELEKRINAAGIAAWIGYGMTETCSHVALRKIGEDTTFTAMPGINFGIDSRDCLIIRSNNFSWRELITNDCVKLISPTEFQWLGRIDNVINSGGIKLHPEILEDEYRKLEPNLPPFYLVGRKNAKWGEVMVMIVERGGETAVSKLIEKIEYKHKRPKEIEYVDSLPLAANGKIKRI